MVPLRWRSTAAAVTRRGAGWAWTAAWCAVLYAAATPWRALDGVADELARWTASAVSLAGVVAGFAVGRLARSFAVDTGRLTHLDLLRWIVVPGAGACAAVTVALAIAGQDDAVRVVLQGALASWAGLDVAYGAVPLMDGQSYALARPLPPPGDTEDGGGGSEAEDHVEARIGPSLL